MGWFYGGLARWVGSSRLLSRYRCSSSWGKITLNFFMENSPLRLEWRSPAELAENPRNWRTHPDAQVAALTDVIAEVGWAGACLFNERTQRLIDGHARQKVALLQGADKVPVLVGDWSEEQEAKILATLDPLAAMAEADAGKLDELLREIETGSEAVAKMLEELAEANELLAKSAVPPPVDSSPQLSEAMEYKIVIDCSGEAEQAALLDEFEGRKINCRAMMV
jgi:ParB-like chromosome segregation protein Spo0J